MLPGKKYAVNDFVEMARRQRWIIAIPLVLGMYAALIASGFVEDMYQSEMLIQVVPQRVPDSYVKSTVTVDTGDRFNALSQQVMSRTELERLIKDMNLYESDRAKLPMQDVVEKMRKNIEVQVTNARTSRNPEPDAFYVRFMYPDKQIATKVTERLGALFIDMNAQDRGDLAQATNNFLKSQLAEQRSKLEAQERKLEDFRQKNAGRLPSQLDFNMQLIQRTNLEVQALVESLARDRDRKLMLERLYNEAQAEMTAMLQLPPAVPAAAAGRGNAADVPLTTDQQLEAAKEALSRYQTRLTPTHPDILRTKRIIAELEKRSAEEAAARAAAGAPADAPVALTPDQTKSRERLRQMQADIESLGRQITFKEGEEQKLRTTVSEYERRIQDVPGLESEYTALTRDYDTQQAAYKNLLSKSEDSQVATELEKRQIGEQFRILDAARPPDHPTGLRRLQVNGIGALAGLIIGIACAAFIELRDTTYRNADDVVKVLKLPVAAVVPYLITDADRRRARKRRLLTSGVATIAVAAGGYVFWAMTLWKNLV
jgi:polysaccharide chain length determinant protein (PEP-CTERM system associated)